MVVPAQKRISKYNVKKGVSMPEAYKSTVNRPDVDLSSLGARADVDAKVSSILGANGIVGNSRIIYHNFARWYEKRVRNLNMSDTYRESAIRFWSEAYGAREEILRQIADAITGTSPGE